MNDQNRKAQTFIESMTRMFPMTVIRLRDPATRMMSTISTAVYGLPEMRLVLLSLLMLAVMRDEFVVSILSDICLTEALNLSQTCRAPDKDYKRIFRVIISHL